MRHRDRRQSTAQHRVHHPCDIPLALLQHVARGGVPTLSSREPHHDAAGRVCARPGFAAFPGDSSTRRVEPVPYGGLMRQGPMPDGAFCHHAGARGGRQTVLGRSLSGIWPQRTSAGYLATLPAYAALEDGLLPIPGMGPAAFMAHDDRRARQPSTEPASAVALVARRDESFAHGTPDHDARQPDHPLPVYGPTDVGTLPPAPCAALRNG